jgi:hypothetical protein
MDTPQEETTMKHWVSERRDWLTSATAALALALAIAALVVGLAAGGDGHSAERFANGMAPPQGMIAPGGGMPPAVQNGPGAPAYPDGDSDSDSSSGNSQVPSP